MKNLISMIFVGFIMLMFFSPVHANTCWDSSGGGTQNLHVRMGAITVQRDAPVGTVIVSRMMGTVIYNTINCDYSGNYLLTRGIVYNGGIPVSDNVYKTNVEGVGIRLKDYSGAFYTNPPTTSPIYAVNGLTSNPVTVEYVKTGNIISGTLSSGTVGSYYITENGITLGTMTAVIMDSGNTISQLACSVTTSTLNFSMGTIQTNDFGSSPGFTPDKKSTQELGMNCDEGANVNITLSGTQNPDVSNKDVLALSNQGQIGVADGVGVQLLYNGVPLVINGLINLKKSSGGMESFPITARYYQTKNIVKPGAANATAILNITYQ